MYLNLINAPVNSLNKFRYNIDLKLTLFFYFVILSFKLSLWLPFTMINI